MSDAIDRDEAIRAVSQAAVPMTGEAEPFIRALRSLPAVPPSPAERLDLDPESLAEAMCAAEFGSAAWGSHPDDGPLRRRFRTRANYVIEWFSAYRAAKPGSTGAAPPAAEPATCGTCGGDGLALTPIGSTKKCPECSPGGAA